jgi:hypothetical protein
MFLQRNLFTQRACRNHEISRRIPLGVCLVRCRHIDPVAIPRLSGASDQNSGSVVKGGVSFVPMRPTPQARLQTHCERVLLLQHTLFIKVVEFARGIVSNLKLAIVFFVVQLSKLFSGIERS